jgi:cytochrome c oxidase assembly protein subunit 15
MIFVMALLGAVTRLTESGLSMVSWDPIMGALPPLNDNEWNKAFMAYQQIPQFQVLNRSMDLAGFKQIFFWEWLHRLWGRLIGIVFIVPLIMFAARGRISRATAMKFLIVFALGAVQGAIGWFMVKSGLSVRTSVSPYRLALHLGFAIAIYAVLLWAVLSGMKRDRVLPLPAVLRRCGWAALVLLAVTMIWGAFTAGLRAGEAYNTWPLMDGQLMPEAAFTLNPLWVNAFENTGLVQFIHRWLGPTTMFVLLGWVASAWRYAKDRRWLKALGGMAMLQVALGLTTLLTHVYIPIAVCHQAGAIILLSLLLVNLRAAADSRQ